MLWNPDARKHMREYLTAMFERTHCQSSDYVFRSNGFLILLFAYFICLRGYQMDKFCGEFGQCSRRSQQKWVRVHLHNILSPNHAFLWHTRHRWVIVLQGRKKWAMTDWKEVRIYRPAIILATVAFGKERSSSVGAPLPEWPSRSDMLELKGRDDIFWIQELLIRSPHVLFILTTMSAVCFLSLCDRVSF